MPEFAEFSRDAARSRREDPLFTLQARGVISLNAAAFAALGQPEAVTLLYDEEAKIIGLRKVEPSYANAYLVRKQSTANSYVLAAQGFTAHYGIPTSRATRFLAHRYDDGVWGFVLAEGQPVRNRKHSGPTGTHTNLWQRTTNGMEVPSLARLGDVGFSHPAYAPRHAAGGAPPSVRLGLVVAAEPLASTPSTPELRRRFVRLLESPTISELVRTISSGRRNHQWRRFGGHGRADLEASLVGSDLEAAPAASARLFLPERGGPEFGRDPRAAQFILEIDRCRTDGVAVPGLDFSEWHRQLVSGMGLSRTVVDFLLHEVGIATGDEPPAQLGVWMRARASMTELVDTGPLSPIPGTFTSNAFTGYVVATTDGVDPDQAAAELLTQMCDYTLHLDEYEEILASLSTKQRRKSSRGAGNG